MKVRETMSQLGAKCLADKIRSYWAAKGLFPKVIVEHQLVAMSAAVQDNTGIYVVRSDMVCGHPRK